MFISLRTLPSARAAMAIAFVAFLLGLAAATLIGPSLSSRTAAAGTPPPSPAGKTPVDDVPALRPHHPAQVMRVVDGDTFDARVNVWPGIEIATRVRLRGIDAPEFQARCRDEQARALAAHDALTRILAEGTVGIFEVTLDKYGGRVLAGASTRRTADVASALLQAGLVRRYAGGRRESWC